MMMFAPEHIDALTPPAIAHLRTTFSAIDMDDDGAITIDDLRSFLQAVGEQSSKFDAMRMFLEMDVRKKRAILFPDFAAYIIEQQAIDVANMEQLFDQLDQDKDGFILPDDMLHVMQPSSEDFKHRLKREFDSAVSGRVNFKQFASRIYPLLKMFSDTSAGILCVNKSSMRFLG